MHDDRESQRYIEYLQRQLVREGSEEFLQGQRQWFEANKSKFAEQIKALSKDPSQRLEALAESLIQHSDEGEYDSFWSRQIFEPLLAKTLKIYNEANFVLRNRVRFANSPGVEVSPAALPSENEHVLFAGHGTSAFCNYWGKVFSTAIYEVSTKCGGNRSPEKMIACLKGSEVIVNAARLALRYALAGSLLGFGKLPQSKEIDVIRIQLVTAMEVFIIGHEIAHFILHEEYPETQGLAPDMTNKDLELQCDAVALAVCTAYGKDENNPFAFQLIGPLLFFYALRICDQAAEILKIPNSHGASDSHPSHQERILFTLDFLKSVGADPETLDSAQYALEVATVIGSQLRLLWNDVDLQTRQEEE